MWSQPTQSAERHCVSSCEKSSGITKASSRLPPASAALPLSAAADTQRCREREASANGAADAHPRGCTAQSAAQPRGSSRLQAKKPAAFSRLAAYPPPRSAAPWQDRQPTLRDRDSGNSPDAQADGYLRFETAAQEGASW
jgi:hypothetical protein